MRLGQEEFTGTFSTSSSLSSDVKDGRLQWDPNSHDPDMERKPVVEEPIVEWTEVTFGPEEVTATGQSSLRVAVTGAFVAHVSFCEA